MDATSLSVSVVSLAIQVFNLFSDGYSSLRRLRDPQNPRDDMVDLQIQQFRFISWAKVTGMSDKGLSQLGDSFMQQTILTALCDMLQLLNDAVTPNNRYGLEFSGQHTSATELLSSPLPGSISQYPPVDGQSPAMDRAQNLILLARASFAVFQQFQCKVSDKRLYRTLIERFREKNDNLESLLPRPLRISAAELYEAIMLQSQDPEHLKRVAHATSSSRISLAQSADFKSNFIESDTNRDVVNRALFIPRARLALDNPSADSRTLAVYEHDALSSGRVLVEWKRFGILKSAASTEESERIMLDRIKRLVVILACQTEASFRSLACIGYTASISGRIGLVFQLPSGVAQANSSVSLHHLLNKPDPRKSQSKPNGILSVSGSSVEKPKCKRPALEDRLRLGHALALSLYRLHRTGVIHKHICPENVVFFPSKSTSDMSIVQPYVTGFGFAREESMINQSEIPDGMTDEEKLYRHPLCDIAKASTKAVDIYALGVLLIEIAGWEAIDSEVERARDRSATGIRAFLLSRFIDSGSLAYRMGTDYQNAVRHCLQVNLEPEEETSDNILGSFYGNVVQGLLPLVS